MEHPRLLRKMIRDRSARACAVLRRAGAKWINDVAVLRAGETATVLGHWVRVGLEETLVTTTTVRTRHVAIPGWLVRHARQLHLHLPARWPWAQQFLAGLERLRSLFVSLVAGSHFSERC